MEEELNRIFLYVRIKKHVYRFGIYMDTESESMLKIIRHHIVTYEKAVVRDPPKTDVYMNLTTESAAFHSVISTRNSVS